MSTELLLLGVIVLVIVLAIVFRNTVIVKKGWKFLLILIPAAFVLVMKLLTPKGDSQEKKDELKNKINDIKDDLQAAHQTAAIEVSAAKTKNNEKLKQVKEVAKIKDKKERLQRLADMMD